MFSQKIIDILNQDAEAKEFNQLFESKMIEHNLTEEEKDKARYFKMMLAIYHNKKAMEILAEETYKEFTKAK